MVFVCLFFYFLNLNFLLELFWYDTYVLSLLQENVRQILLICIPTFDKPLHTQPLYIKTLSMHHHIHIELLYILIRLTVTTSVVYYIIKYRNNFLPLKYKLYNFKDIQISNFDSRLFCLSNPVALMFTYFSVWNGVHGGCVQSTGDAYSS
jgi:hypothetical protein